MKKAKEILDTSITWGAFLKLVAAGVIAGGILGAVWFKWQESKVLSTYQNPLDDLDD